MRRMKIVIMNIWEKRAACVYASPAFLENPTLDLDELAVGVEWVSQYSGVRDGHKDPGRHWRILGVRRRGLTLLTLS